MHFRTDLLQTPDLSAYLCGNHSPAFGLSLILLAQAYAEKYTSNPDLVLDELAGQTYSTHSQSHMLSGKVQGRFLEMISCMVQTQKGPGDWDLYRV